MKEIEVQEMSEALVPCWKAAGSHLSKQVDGGTQSWLRAHRRGWLSACATSTATVVQGAVRRPPLRHPLVHAAIQNCVGRDGLGQRWIADLR